MVWVSLAFGHTGAWVPRGSELPVHHVALT